MTPSWITTDYLGADALANPPFVWKPYIRPFFDKILPPAVQIVSQYIVVWMQSVQSKTVTVDGNTAGVAVLLPPENQIAVTPNGQYSIGSFNATAGQAYKLTTCFTVSCTGFGPSGSGIYFSVGVSNADASGGAAVVVGTGWRACVMLGFLLAQNTGPVNLTLCTAAADCSGYGTVQNVRVIVETFSA